LALRPADDDPPAAPRVLAVPGTTRWTPTGADLAVTVAGPEGAAGGQLALDLGAAWRPSHVDVAEHLIPPGGTSACGQATFGPDVADVADRLVVRPREPGDRVRTAVGTRKLQNVLVDAGVPRFVRDLVPVVAVDDRVLWVAGVIADADALAAGQRDPRLHLALSPGSRRPPP
jgi:tRNA(Ile)-lysidine synthase